MFTGTPERINEMRDWYAFHTLRRMFRNAHGLLHVYGKTRR